MWWWYKLTVSLSGLLVHVFFLGDAAMIFEADLCTGGILKARKTSHLWHSFQSRLQVLLLPRNLWSFGSISVAVRSALLKGTRARGEHISRRKRLPIDISFYFAFILDLDTRWWPYHAILKSSIFPFLPCCLLGQVTCSAYQGASTRLHTYVIGRSHWWTRPSQAELQTVWFLHLCSILEEWC